MWKKLLGSGHFQQVGSGNPKHKYFLFGLGRAYFILSSLRKNIELKLVLNNAVLKGWKAEIFISINGSV